MDRERKGFMKGSSECGHPEVKRILPDSRKGACSATRLGSPLSSFAHVGAY